MTGSLFEEEFLIYKAKQYSLRTGVVQFWDAETRGMRTYYARDIADISKKKYDTRIKG